MASLAAICSANSGFLNDIPKFLSGSRARNLIVMFYFGDDWLFADRIVKFRRAGRRAKFEGSC